MRSKVNEYELAFNNKKKNFKYEIQLDAERQYLDDLENEDPSNLDISAFGGGASQRLVKNGIEFSDIRSEAWPDNKSLRLSKKELSKDKPFKATKDPYDFSNMTQKDIRKYKEQILTDMLCSIPSSL